jgi:hypothetical protein
MEEKTEGTLYMVTVGHEQPKAFMLAKG